MNIYARFYLSVALVALVSCSTVSRKEQEAQREAERTREDAPRLREHAEMLQKIKDNRTPPPPTPEEERATKEGSVAYYTGLVASVRALDDETSSASTIARAAISENLELLRTWKRARLANFSRMNPDVERLNKISIANLPSSEHVDEATSLVLRHRNGTLDFPTESR